MNTSAQAERAADFRRFHQEAPMLVLPNVWDAASARIVAQTGFRAIATTSSGVAAALGYSDGQQISRDMLIEALARITRVVDCPVSADIEAGYGDSIDAVLATLEAVIATGVVGVNIEDSRAQDGHALVDIAYQVGLITAMRALATSLAVPFVINARVDLFLLASGEPETRVKQAVERANAYLQAGADCVFPIGWLDYATVERLVKAINGPVNILAGPSGPTLAELAQLGVARVSFGGGLLSAALGRVRGIAQELLESGSYAKLAEEALPSAEFRSLFD